jgi:hypothetical protein
LALSHPSTANWNSREIEFQDQPGRGDSPGIKARQKSKVAFPGSLGKILIV